MRKILIIGCLSGASFFIGCNQETTSTSPDTDPVEKDLEMYEESELALLMRKMYEDNVALGKELEAGNIPESFPEDFYKIHDAISTEGMVQDKNTFDGLASQYVANMEKIKNASTAAEGKIAYNAMVLTCATCHQIYCQGPLPKIRRMTLKLDE